MPSRDSDSDGDRATTRGRWALRIAGALSLSVIAYLVLAWLGGPVPVPCGPRICAPFFHCVIERGIGTIPAEGPYTVPADEHRCEPGMGPRREALRPSAPPEVTLPLKPPAVAAPVPCGTATCDPSMHCVHEHGQGQAPHDGGARDAPADVFRCAPGAGPAVDAPRPAAPLGPSSR